MTWLLLILGLLAAALSALFTRALVRDYREAKRWRRERERIAAYHERMAARNSRPHTDAVSRCS